MSNILLEADHVLVMRNRGGGDRLRRIKFSRIQQVSFQRKPRWFTLVICGLLVGLGVLIGASISWIAASFILVPALAAMSWAGYHGRTLVIVQRESDTDSFKSTSSRGKVERFRHRLDTAVRERHRQDWAVWDDQAASRNPATPAETPADSDPTD